jgi:hypothetical protein
MMKRMIVSMAALSLLVSGAYAANVGITALPPTGVGTSSATSISTDGLYVAGNGMGTQATPYITMQFWYAPTATPTEYTAKGAGYYGGIDNGGGSLWTSANGGTTVYSAANFIGRMGSHAPGTPSLSVLLDHTGAGSNVVVGGNNSASVNVAGTDSWVAGYRTSGTTSKGNEGYVWKWSNGLSPWRTVNGTGKLILKSVSQTGRVVGNDKGNNSTGGGSAKDRALWVETDATTVQAIPNFAGNTFYLMSQGYGVSADGSQMSGYMYDDVTAVGNGSRLQGFIWNVGDANAKKLMPAGGSTQQSAEQAVAFDVQNSIAVGYSWRTDTGNRACIWLPDGSPNGYTDALLLQDWLPTIGVDLTGWTLGGVEYGAVGIASLGGNQYALTGTGARRIRPSGPGRSWPGPGVAVR